MSERVVNSAQMEYFNTSVRGWGMSVKKGLKKNANAMLSHDQKRKYDKYRKLANSITASFQKKDGIVNSINFRFGFQGYFVHLGVGRGYIVEGGMVKRGRKYKGDEIGALLGRGYTRREINKMRYTEKNQRGIKRRSVDWFDAEIRNSMGWLAEYVGDFWGESAMKLIIDQIDKGLHTYVKYVKVKTNKKK